MAASSTVLVVVFWGPEWKRGSECRKPDYVASAENLLNRRFGTQIKIRSISDKETKQCFEIVVADALVHSNALKGHGSLQGQQQQHVIRAIERAIETAHSPSANDPSTLPIEDYYGDFLLTPADYRLPKYTFRDLSAIYRQIAVTDNAESHSLINDVGREIMWRTVRRNGVRQTEKDLIFGFVRDCDPNMPNDVKVLCLEFYGKVLEDKHMKRKNWKSIFQRREWTNLQRRLVIRRKRDFELVLSVEQWNFKNIIKRNGLRQSERNLVRGFVREFATPDEIANLCFRYSMGFSPQIRQWALAEESKARKKKTKCWICERM